MPVGGAEDPLEREGGGPLLWRVSKALEKSLDLIREGKENRSVSE